MANSDIYIAKKLFDSSGPYYASSGYWKLSDILTTRGTSSNLSSFASATGAVANTYSSYCYDYGKLPSCIYTSATASWQPCLKGYKPWWYSPSYSNFSLGAGTYYISRGTDSSGDYISISGSASITLRASNFSFENAVPYTLSYLIVGGGGGGGADKGTSNGAGGGAGGAATGNIHFGKNEWSFKVVVGTGGSGGNSDGASGSNGNSSILSVLIGSTYNVLCTVYYGYGGIAGGSYGDGGTASSTLPYRTYHYYHVGVSGGNGGGYNSGDPTGSSITCKGSQDDSGKTYSGSGGSRSAAGPGGGSVIANGGKGGSGGNGGNATGPGAGGGGAGWNLFGYYAGGYGCSGCLYLIY